MIGSPTALSLESFIKSQAMGLGFDLVGIAKLGAAETAPMFEDWLSRGYAGEMAYLERGAEKRRDTRLPFAPAVSAIVVALDYGGRQGAGPVARYARGDDYHEVMTDRLNELHRAIEAEIGRPVAGKAYVDTGPILERDLARKAGLGWFGKSTNLVNPRIGSFFFIGSLVIDLELEPDAPFEQDRCGTCTRCIEACPTGAIVDERVVDATRCISYLTIEKRGEISKELAPMIGEHVYGCDICQDVCPWNVSFAQELKEPAFAARAFIAEKDARTLANDLLVLDEESFREAFRRSPMKRAKWAGLARNAKVVLRNIGLSMFFATMISAPRAASAQARTLKGRIQLNAVYDSTYKRQRNIYVYTPPNYSRAKAGGYDLLLLFDADQQLADSALLFSVDSLAAIRKVEPFVIVMMDNGSGAERLGDLANDPRMPGFLATQVVPWLRAGWNVTRDPHRTIISGSSAGGLGALYVALERPDLFGNVLAQSAALWRGARGSNAAPFEWLTDQYRRTPKKDIRIAMSVGEMETRGAIGGTAPSILSANRHLVEVLRAKGYVLSYTEVRNGQHRPEDWNPRFPADLILLTSGWPKP